MSFIHTSTFTARPSVGAADFSQANLTQDATWRDLSLASILPDGAKAVALHITIQSASTGKQVFFRQKGVTFPFGGNRTLVANLSHDGDCVVGCDADRIIQYFSDTSVTIQIYVVGWWK